jgi:hypothetical protein
MIGRHELTAATLLASILTAAAAGQEAVGPETGPPAGERSSIRWRLAGGAAHQFDTNIDDGGEFSLTRATGSVGVSIDLDPKWRLDLGAGYEFDAYDFSGSSGFGGLDPWGDVDSVRMRTQLSYQVNSGWSIFGGPIFGFSAERDADFTNSFTAGGLVGARFRVSSALTLSAGVGGLSQIDDDPVVFPFVTFNWQAREGFAIRSGPFDVGASGGFGVEAAWEITDRWELSVGAIYQSRRFRLDDEGIAPEGVGEETAFPIYVRGTWKPTPKLSVNVYGGVIVGGELRLEDDRGRRISEQDFDPAPMIGVGVRFRF